MQCIIQHSISHFFVLHCILLYHIAFYCINDTIECNMIQGIILHSIALYCLLMYHIAFHCIASHSIVGPIVLQTIVLHCSCICIYYLCLEFLNRKLSLAVEDLPFFRPWLKAKTKDEMETATDVGLVRGHAYGITAVRRVALKGTGMFNLFNREKLPMIRLRNPWGGCEWKGPFSDGYSL